jgi:hypothetical protein
MMRNIVNKPHLTPNPDKPHAPGAPERGGESPGARKPAPNPYMPADHGADPGSGPAAEEPTYDSCFDDLNMILSQSIQEPDPDPNLDSPAGNFPRLPLDQSAPQIPKDRGKTPRTSEIFRSVVAPAAGKPSSAEAAPKPQGSPKPQQEARTAAESSIPEVVLDRDGHIQELASEEEDRLSDPQVSWGHVLLLSYSSAITLAMIWMLWTGRWSKGPAPAPSASDRPTPESASRPAEPTPDSTPPPIPAENLATLGKTIRLGDLDVTPLSVTAAPVQLRRSIQPQRRRSEEASLILRIKLSNISEKNTFTPLDQNLVRERGLRPHDPYIETSEGTTIRLFPLAIDSEWSIVGQEFSELQPGDTEETFIVAEPGAARELPGEMTWRVRLRTGVYRTDTIGVRFTKDEVRRRSAVRLDDDDRSPR